MKQVLFVFIGGGFGSAMRYLITKYLNNTESIPYGTLLVNVLGSLLIGFVLGFALRNEALNQNQTLVLATGFCGGFTTFSAFAYENHLFLKNGDFMNFAIYTLASIIIGFIAVFIGLYLVKMV